MKSWIKKMKRLFSGNSNKELLDDHCSNIMSERLAQRTRHRKTNQHGSAVKSHKRDPAIPTYGDAESWVKKNRYVLEQTLDMIELYPELIKQPACNKLVDFMAKVGINTNNMPHNHFDDISDESLVSGRFHAEEQSDHSEVNIPVPEILVSHAQEDELLCDSRSPIVFVCGNLDDNNWHRLLVGLSRIYTVHSFSPKHSSFNHSIQLSDILLFLMDETSVNDHRYTEQIRAAVTKGIEIVYVRDMSFEFRDPGVDFTKRRSSKTSFVSQTIRTQTLTTSLTDFKFEQSQTRRYSLDNFSIESDELTSHVDPVLKTSPLNADQMDRLSASTYNGRPATPKQTLDLVNILRLEYGTAHGYHQVYHEQCLDRIVVTIDSKFNTLSRAQSSSAFSCSSNYSPNARVSMYSSVSNDSAIDDMYRSLSPPSAISRTITKNVEFAQSTDSLYMPRELPPEPTETVFLVSDESSPDKPIVFHWPEDADECKSIISSPSIDSFGFQDVDLSKRINQLDLFGSNQSD